MIKIHEKMSNSLKNNELTLTSCAGCGQNIIIMNKFIRPKMYCTLHCMDKNKDKEAKNI
jgi:hypothetical protein